MRRRRSITTPIIVGSATVALAVAMLVGWTLVIVTSVETMDSVDTWLLVLGIVSLTVIVAVLVMFVVFLVRGILENRRQVTFIDSVTHELKSPLASLKLCLETLQRAGVSPEQRAELRNMMLGDVERLSAFIDDVLAANRLSHENESRERVEIAARPLFERCVARVSRRYDLPPDAVTLAVPDGLTLVSDTTALETVVQNLLDNAVKYSDPPVRVALSAHTEAGDAIIRVQDHGIGLSTNDNKRIFQRFYRVDSEPVRRRRGTGLGLYVVSALVRGLGGSLRADSDGLGLGTCVEVTLTGAMCEAAPEKEDER